jgi:hypothetical protein
VVRKWEESVRPLPIGLDFFQEHISARARHFIRGPGNLAGWVQLAQPEFVQARDIICSRS